MSIVPLRGFAKSVAAAAIAGGCLVGATTSAQANVHWVVQATFDDTTQLTGEFFIDVYGYVRNWNLTTVTGSIPSATYVPVINSIQFPPYPSPPPTLGADFFGDEFYFGDLRLTFTNDLGIFSLNNPIQVGGLSWECYGWACPGGAPTRYIVSGFATAIPEPATWAMMLLGFAGIGFAVRRQRRKDELVPKGA